MKLQKSTNNPNTLTLLLDDVFEEEQLFCKLTPYVYEPNISGEHRDEFRIRINEIRAQMRDTQKGYRAVEIDLDTAKIILRTVFERAVASEQPSTAPDYADDDQLTLQSVSDAEAVYLPHFPSGRYDNPPAEAFEFLAKRGVSAATAKWLFAHKNLWQSENGECCFPIKNDDGEDVAAEVWDMREPSWGTVGVDTGCGYTVCIGKTDENSPIWFFDNAVNLLLALEKNCSEWKERGEAVRLVSMGGLSFSTITRYAELYPTAEIYLSADNGNKQSEFVSEVTKYLTDNGVCRCNLVE